MNPERDQLTAVRGVVTACDERLHSVRVDRSTGCGKVNKSSELWLRDQAGREHRYQGDLFEAAQPGHEVTVVIRQNTGKPIAFANHATGVVHEDRELATKVSVPARLVDTFGISLLCALPGLIPWFAILDTIGLGDKAFSASALQVYVLLLAGCVYAGLTVWSKGYAERVDKLRSEIDRLIIERGKPKPSREGERTT